MRKCSSEHEPNDIFFHSVSVWSLPVKDGFRRKRESAEARFVHSPFDDVESDRDGSGEHLHKRSHNELIVFAILC